MPHKGALFLTRSQPASARSPVTAGVNGAVSRGSTAALGLQLGAEGGSSQSWLVTGFAPKMTKAVLEGLTCLQAPSLTRI